MEVQKRIFPACGFPQDQHVPGQDTNVGLTVPQQVHYLPIELIPVLGEGATLSPTELGGGQAQYWYAVALHQIEKLVGAFGLAGCPVAKHELDTSVQLPLQDALLNKAQ